MPKALPADTADAEVPKGHLRPLAMVGGAARPSACPGHSPPDTAADGKSGNLQHSQALSPDPPVGPRPSIQNH
jgi:hypothetical protein